MEKEMRKEERKRRKAREKLLKSRLNASVASKTSNAGEYVDYSDPGFLHLVTGSNNSNPGKAILRGMQAHPSHHFQTPEADDGPRPTSEELIDVLEETATPKLQGVKENDPRGIPQTEANVVKKRSFSIDHLLSGS